MVNRSACLAALSFLVASGFGVAGVTERADLERLLDERFLPYVDWRDEFDLDGAGKKSGRYWRTPEEVVTERGEAAARLEGLRLALDPGHIGGFWAVHEGREFRIDEGDFRIREGELVLEVAKLVRERLEALGAEVTLLRETNERVNPRGPLDYLLPIAERFPPPREGGLAAMADYALELRRRAVRESVVVGELMARARRVNERIRPDALISLHIDAARWPTTEGGARKLVQTNASHVLIFGALLPSEFASARQRERLRAKLGAAAVEAELGAALAASVAGAWDLPPIQYGGRNAVPVREGRPYLWARNLMILREVDCPTVMIEPFVANSEWGYARLQAAQAVRAAGGEDGDLPDEDVLAEYAEAVVEGVLAVYGSAVVPNRCSVVKPQGARLSPTAAANEENVVESERPGCPFLCQKLIFGWVKLWWGGSTTLGRLGTTALPCCAVGDNRAPLLCGWGQPRSLDVRLGTTARP